MVSCKMKFLSGQISRIFDSIRNLISFDSSTIGLSKKRECERHYCFDDSDDDVVFEPPLKRSRLHNYDNKDSIKRTGSIAGDQIFGSLASLPHAYQRLDSLKFLKYTKEKENSVGTIKINNSSAFYKENFNKTMVDCDTKESDEVNFLESVVTIPRSPHFKMDASFKFNPTNVTSEFCPKITSTVSRQMGTASRGRHIFALKKSREFLDSKGTPLKVKKPNLLGKYTNSKTLGFSNLNTPVQCIKLCEKKAYKKLLEQFLNRPRPISDVQHGTNIRKNAFSIAHLDHKYTSEKKASFNREIQNRTKFPTVVSSNNERLRSSPFEVPVIDLETDEDLSRNNNEEEIFVTKHVKPPKYTPINKLEEKLLKYESYRSENLLNIKAEYEDKNKIHQESIKKIEEQLKRSKFNNHHNVENLSKSLSKLTTKFPVEYIEISEEEEVKLAELSKEIKGIIHHAFKGGSPSQVLAEKFSIQITRKDICTLAGLNWLNDEIINFYMNMIVDRSQKEKGFPKVYAFNTFFYSKLISTGYGTVRRWTKKIDIFLHDLLIIPVHLGMHWCLAIIDFRSKSIRYYDSMLGDNNKCLKELGNYLENEYMDKKKRPFDTSLTMENMKDIPQQMNGSDCGMFACKFAEYLSRNASITFTQENMPYFRHRMVYEIVTQKLMNEPLKPYT